MSDDTQKQKKYIKKINMVKKIEVTKIAVPDPDPQGTPETALFILLTSSQHFYQYLNLQH